MMTTLLTAATLAAALLFPGSGSALPALGVPGISAPLAIPGPPTRLPDWAAPVSPFLINRPFVAPVGRYAAGHRGVDVSARVGQPVTAPGPGAVVFAGRIAGRWVMSIAHPSGLAPLPPGSWRTTYEGVRPDVPVGRQVTAGDVIGTFVGGGHASGLHWGLKNGPTYLDPLMLLKRSIVLKPFSASAQ